MKTLLLAFNLICNIQGSSLKEVSGMAFSKQHKNTFWVHNDSGDGNYLYALDLSGKTLGKFEVTGGTTFDWEDIAAGKCPDSEHQCLFIADTGDKNGTRGGLSVLILVEPVSLSAEVVPVKEIIHFKGEGRNFESLAWSASEKSFLLIEKKGKRFGKNPKNPALFQLSLSGELKELGEIDLSSHSDDSEDTLVTAADMVEGKILVGTYGKAFILNRNLEVEEAFDLPAVPKAEAMAWGPGGIYVTGEESHPGLWKLDL